MFEGAYLKTKRANKHILDFHAAFGDFVASHPPRITIGTDAEFGGITVEVHFGEDMPGELSLIIGDAIHNLGTALDHATWELIGLDGGTQDRWCKFPAGHDEISYVAACKGIKTPCTETKEFFIKLGAYKHGPMERLYAIHCLDIADKHTVLTPIIGIGALKNVMLKDAQGKFMGKIDMSAAMLGHGRARVMGLAPGLFIELDRHPEADVEAFFGDTEFFKLEAIVSTLNLLCGTTNNVIRQFEAFVRSRK